MALRRAWIFGVAFAAFAAGGARAEDDFYRGKVVTLVIGDPPGGGADTYARLYAQHLPRFLPGAPSVVVQNMPGASSVVAANYAYKTAPKDGTLLVMPQAAAVFARMFGNQAAAYQPDEFQWVGNLDQATGTCSAWKGSGLKSFEDLINKPVLLAAVAPSGVASEYPRALNALYGTRIKVIHGYVGTGNIVIAMQNGEIQGSCAFMVSALKSAFRTHFENGDLTPILQAARRDPELKGVPHILDLARDDGEREVMRLISDRDIMARSIALPPGAPADRVATMRRAFDAIMKDPAFLEGAAKANLPILPNTGAEIEALVKRMMAAPAPVVARARAALEFGITENVDLKSLAGAISKVGRDSIELTDADGTARTVKMSGAATAIMVAGAQGNIEGLKTGMTCSLRYSADNMAQVVTCK